MGGKGIKEGRGCSVVRMEGEIEAVLVWTKRRGGEPATEREEEMKGEKRATDGNGREDAPRERGGHVGDVGEAKTHGKTDELRGSRRGEG